MIKGRSLIGLKVVSHEGGSELGAVQDLVFDHEANCTLALLLSDRELFGLIDAQIVPWEQIQSIGQDAIVVASDASKMKAGDDPQVKRILDRETALAGTKMYTTDGKYLGTLGDVMIDPQTGRIEGYELSGGLVRDTISGKRYVAALEKLDVGRQVAFVSPEVGEALEAQPAQPEDAGGLQAKLDEASRAARAAYREIANASIEKQKAYVVGKRAARDVIVGAREAAETTPESVACEPAEIAVLEAGAMPPASESELLNPAQAAATDITSQGEVVSGEVIVRAGETITAAQAERAADAGVLHQLVASAAGAAATSWNSDLQQRAATAALGQTAQYSVTAPDGRLVVARGETITPQVMEQARACGRQSAVIAAAGLGAASQGAQELGESLSRSASSLWQAVKEKTGEWTQVAENKKREWSEEEQQARIRRALGRPVTRAILDRDDNILLRAGDLITHQAVAAARQAGVLDMLLDSAHFGSAHFGAGVVPVEVMEDDAPLEAEDKTETPR